MINLCLGIDFGTSNSCISVWYKNQNILVQDIDGNNIIPTIIEINDNRKIIGKSAYIRKDINNNSFTIYEIKKLIGKKYSSLSDDFKKLLAYNIKSDDNDNILIVNNDNKEFYVEEIATHIFMSFKSITYNFLKNIINQDFNIDNVIISVPAYFNEIQRETIKKSAENANFTVLRLINEPTAAAIAYGYNNSNNSINSINSINSNNINYNDNDDNNDDNNNNKKRDKNIKNIMVIDLGGGTLDISVLNIIREEEIIMEVIGSSGNSNLGGSDFDNKIMEYCIMEFIEKNNIEYDDFIEKVDEDNLQKLKYLSELCKISLTNNTKSGIIINNFYKNKNLKIEISREKFNELINNLIYSIVNLINELLYDLELNKEELDDIILVGGMTRVPIIRYTLERYFNNELNYSINPDNVVAIGASILGYMILNKDNINDKILLIDRTSLSIGIETTGGIMDVLIARNSIIPTKKVKKYTTDTDDMEEIEIKIYEGERIMTKDNYLIGEFKLSGIEKEPKGIPEIEITFEIDNNGIIKIRAQDLKNALNKNSLMVSYNKQNLSKEKLEEIVENAKKMDNIDKNNRKKLEYYINIEEMCKLIYDNIKNNEELNMDEIKKNEIIENINEVLEWLEKNKDNYYNIEIEKYIDLKEDIKNSYGIFIYKREKIDEKNKIDKIENYEDENKEKKFVEIYGEDEKKYIEYIQEIKEIIERYNNILKMKIINDKEKINNILEKSNDLIIKILTNKNINKEIIEEDIKEIRELNIQYNNNNNNKSEIDIITELIQQKENYYIDLIDNNENKEKIDEYKRKLDIISDIDMIVYKIVNNYEEYDKSKIIEILNILEYI